MKVAVVTGASYGLGKSIAEMLLSEGYKVYGISRTEPKIEDKNFVWIKADITKLEQVKLLINKVSEKKISLLVNNAGTAFLENALTLTPESFGRMFDINFLAQIYVTREFEEKLNGGMVINISSLSDRYTDNMHALYSASKAALNIYFDGISNGCEIKVINFLPDYIDTPLQHTIRKGLDFDWDLPMTTQEVSVSIKNFLKNTKDFPNRSRIMVVNNKLMEDTEDPEKLYYYNVDTKEFKKLK